MFSMWHILDRNIVSKIMSYVRRLEKREQSKRNYIIGKLVQIKTLGTIWRNL
jgi:hypothetical protein